MTTFLFANVLVSGINIVGDLAADSSFSARVQVPLTLL